MEKVDKENLFFRFCQGDVSAEEIDLVENLLAESSLNKEVFDRIQALAFSSELGAVEPCLDVDGALQSVNDRTRGERAPLSAWMWFQRVAAVLLLPLIGLCAFLLVGRGAEIRMVEMKTQPGMVASVVLPDSSVVTLNSNSSIKYPSDFRGDVRQVELNGEAFFDVTKDEAKKFIVNTPNATKIIVYGTEFNVEAYANENVERATLQSGKIGFVYNHDGHERQCMMSPDERITYDVSTGNVMRERIPVEVETSWKDGMLVFKNTPFDQILRRVGRYYNVKFNINDESLATLKFTGTFKHQSLNNVLKGFNISSNIEFKFNDDPKNEMQTIEVSNPLNNMPMDKKK